MSYMICQDGVYKQLEGKAYQRYTDQIMNELESTEVIRSLCSREKILDILDRIEFIRTIPGTTAKLYQEFYAEAMEKYDEEEWVRVIKTEYTRSKLRHSENFEKEYARQAKDFLYSEVSILLDIPFEEVERYIVECVHEKSWD